MSTESASTALSLQDYEREVRMVASKFLTQGGEDPVPETASASSEHKAGLSVLSAALNMIGYVRSERFSRMVGRAPYDVQEARVAEYISHRAGVGGGMDPVGFLIASHSGLSDLVAQYRQRVAELEAQIHGVGLDPVLPELTPEEATMADRAVGVYAKVIGETFGKVARRDDHWSQGMRHVCLRLSVPADTPLCELFEMKRKVHDAVRAIDKEVVGEVDVLFDRV